MSRQVVVVPHTHWDREWYQPYQTFRLRLVDLLDDLLPRLDADPSYRHFLLDGQMAVVDDYLAVRPEAEPVLRRLATAGRLAMGPWYILMDEFLVSGETMIRDLQLGLDRAADLRRRDGRSATCPTCSATWPRCPSCCRSSGSTTPSCGAASRPTCGRPAFWWRVPDGSTVRAQYLPDGYSNGATLPDSGKELVAQIERFEHTYGSLAGDETSGPLLWMNGTDHQMPQAWLGPGRRRGRRGAGPLRHPRSDRWPTTSPPRRPTGSTSVDGELRSGAYANLLMGVASNRVDVHQASAWVERGLERLAEPLSALWLPPDRVAGRAPATRPGST